MISINVRSAKTRRPLSILLLLLGLGVTQQSSACGGFFCEVVPIDQAAEQIVFRQEGDQTTAMIKIDYVGNAEDFGWVLPVPQSPELSLGSDLTFTELELSTRPQFLLERKGEGCSLPVALSNRADSVPLNSGAFDADANESSVTIEQTLSVGPFDAQIISSNDPAALAEWLSTNNLDLTEKGSELLKPYIDAKSKFVVLKLKNTANAGNIQPIILKYKSDAPVIPMTLTAVAAQDDMGVLVWLLGDGRGVPKNFKHVTPNYTRLNWFSGTRSAYASYQSLITEAMDESGGQGFATDFAGHLPNLKERFTTAQNWENLLADQQNLSDASFIAALWQNGRSSIIQDAVRGALPTSDAFVYSQPLTMQEVFSPDQLKLARATVTKAVEEQLITPINNAIDILDDDLYLSRLYTTLSAADMTMNPEFTFNPSMDGQSLTRNATLTAACVNKQDHWTLKLGKGTGRDDELVVDAWGLTPPFRGGITNVDQKATWQVEKTSANSAPIVLAQSSFSVARLGSTPTNTDGIEKKKKSGSFNGFSLAMIGLLAGFSALIRASRRRFAPRCK